MLRVDPPVVSVEIVASPPLGMASTKALPLLTDLFSTSFTSGHSSPPILDE
jgi:hypothetical protein